MNFNLNQGLPIASLFWIGAVLAAFVVGVLGGAPIHALLPYAGVGILPALAGIMLWPYSEKEWAQVLIILSWIALAITACFAIAFVPMAILFLCAPMAAALFEREKVVEAMVLSAIFAAVVFYASKLGYAPAPIASSEQINWGQLAGIMSTIAFMIGAMYFASNSSEATQDYELVEKAGFADAYPGAGLKFSSDGSLIAATDYALKLFGFSQQDMGMVGLEDIIPDTAGAANDSMLLSSFNEARDSKKTVSLIITSPDVSPETGEHVFLKLEFVSP